jgi:hypothetical protein
MTVEVLKHVAWAVLSFSSMLWIWNSAEAAPRLAILLVLVLALCTLLFVVLAFAAANGTATPH